MSRIFSTLVTAFSPCAFGLGIWQVYRLSWKRGLIEERTSQFYQPAVELPSELTEDKMKEIEFRPVEFVGTFDHDREQFISPRWGQTNSASTTREVGYHVLTPLVRPNGERILVNRGWIPAKMKSPESRAEGQLKGEVLVRGLVRSGDKSKPSFFSPDNFPEKEEWHWLDVPSIASAANTRPILVDALPEPKNPGGFPMGGTTPVNLPNNHLEYAITWFSLGTITGLMALRARGYQMQTLTRLFSRNPARK